MVRKDVEQAIAAADSFDGFITELQNMGYTVKYGPRVEHIAVRHKDAQRNIRIDRLDPRFSETALREYYRQLHRMPTEMQQEYRQENAPAKPKWQPTELQPMDGIETAITALNAIKRSAARRLRASRALLSNAQMTKGCSKMNFSWCTRPSVGGISSIKRKLG